jgi:hypothetical protein
MHEILSRHPSFLAFEEKVGKLDEAEAAWRERTSAARADYKAQVADYRREKQAALLSGSEPPVEPEPLPDNSDEARLFLDQWSALRARRRDLLADLAPEAGPGGWHRPLSGTCTRSWSGHSPRSTPACCQPGRQRRWQASRGRCATC